MPFGDFDPLRPGERFTAAELNRLADAVEALGQSSSAYGSAVGIDRTGGGIQPVDGTSPGHWGKITGVAAGLHAHVQVTPDGAECPATADFAYGTAVVNGVPAREVNGLTAATGTVVWMTLDSYRRGWVFSLSAAGAGGFYASLTGTGSPYSFAEVAGPAVGSAAVTGGRTGTANATEVLTGLAGIPAGTVVWMTEGGATAYRFACIKIVYVTAWQINTGTPCTLTPATTVAYYLSSANLCGRAV